MLCHFYVISCVYIDVLCAKAIVLWISFTFSISFVSFLVYYFPYFIYFYAYGVCSVLLYALCHFLWIYRRRRKNALYVWMEIILQYETKKEKFCICWMLPNATKYIVCNCLYYEYMLIVFLHLCVCCLKCSSLKWHK